MKTQNLNKIHNTKKIRVAMFQRIFSHYRQAVFRALATHPLLDFTLLHGKETIDGIECIQDDSVVHCIKGHTRPLAFNGRIYLMPHAVEYARREDYDVMIIPNDVYCPSVWQVHRAARKRNKRVVIFAIGFSQYKQWLRDKMRVWWAHKVDAMVLYSYAHRERYIKHGVPAEKIFVAPNALDTKKIEAAEADMTSEKLNEFKKINGLTNSFNIIHAGRMVDFKQLELLLNAAVKLTKVLDNLRLILIGDGPKLEEWKQLSRNLGISDKVIWPGAVYSHDSLCYWFHSSHLCVAPAQQGLIANLCHSYGVPLITSDNPRWQGPEIQVFTEGKTGLLYKYGNVDDLSEKIAELIKNPERIEKMGKEARRKIFEDFTMEKMCRGFVDSIMYAINAKRNG